MTKKLVLLAALLFATACSGSTDENLGNECVVDDDCADGAKCQKGYCSGEGHVEPSVDSGGVTVDAASGSMGAPGAVVTVTTGDCMGPKCTIAPGSDVTFTAEPVDGYRFTGWSGDPLCKGSDPVLMLKKVNANIKCIANYVKRVKVSGAGGAGVSADSEDPYKECKGASCTVDAGQTVVISAGAHDGQRFTGFTGAGCDDVSGMSVTVHTGTMDVTCTATYVGTFNVAGSVSGASDGSVAATSTTKAASCSDDNCTVDTGGQVTLTAPTLAGYRFTGWSGDMGCNGSTAAISFDHVMADVKCVANYVKRFVVTLAADGAPAQLLDGKLHADSDDAFKACTGASCETDAGGSVTLSADTVDGYRLTGFSGDGCGAVAGSTVSVSALASDVTCTAHYVEGIAVIANVVGADGTVAIAATSPQGACENGSCVIDEGSDVTLTAPSIAQHRFMGWSGDPECTGSELVLTLSKVAASITCNANYSARFTATGAASTGGAVSADSTDPSKVCTDTSCTVDAGKSVSLTASAAANFRFTGWTGGGVCTGLSNPLVIDNLQADITCTASFIRRFNVSFPDPAQGSIAASNVPASAVCDGDSCVVDQGAGLRLTATADANYRFTRWSGCSTSTNAVLDLASITSDLTCTANFVRRFKVSFPDPTGGAIAASNTPADAVCTSTDCVLDTGEGLRLTATADSGYRFDHWSGCSSSTNPVLDVANVTADATCSASFTRQFTVTYSAGTGGSVSAPANQCPAGSPCTLDTGASVDITATPGGGYRFGGWSGAGCTDSVTSTANVADLVNITGNVTCTASFVRQFTVTYAAGGGGSVAAPAAQCPAGSPCVVDTGATVNVTATPSNGYRFGGWSGNGCTDANTNTANVADLANISGNITCTASFVQQFTVTYSAGAGGAVSAPGNQCANGSPCIVDSGDDLSITATPGAGYRFGGWTGAGCVDANTNTASVADLANIGGNITCNASFVRQFTVTYSAGTGGSVSAPAGQCPSGSPCTLDSGDDLSVTATPSASYRFGGWSGAGCVDGNTNTASVVDLQNVAGNVVCTASFVRQISVTYTAGTGGTVSAPANQCPAGSPCTLDSGADLNVTASASAGYRFGGWTGTGCTDSVPGTANVADLANLANNVTCAASFVRLVTVTYAAGNGGSVSAPANQCPAGSPCTLDSGSSLDVTATANAGFRFGGWSGAGCSDSNTSTANVADLVNIAGNVTCTASFVQQFTVTYSAGTGGSVSAPANQCAAGSPCTVDTGADLGVTATPSSGYRFGGWSGAGCVDSNTSTPSVADLANIASNVTCSASFVRQVVVTYAAGTGGSVSAPANQCPAGSPCTLDTGANLDVTATASTGYRFGGWAGAGCTDSDTNTASVADLVNLTANATCTASFVKQVVVAYSAGTGGSVSSPANQCPAGSPCTLDTGANLDVTATASTGYRFGGWTGTGCTDSATNTPAVADLVNITGNVTCTASFVRQVVVTYSAGSGGSVSAPANQCAAGSPCTLDTGANLAITAAASAGYRFGGWSGTGCTDSDTNTANVADLANISSNVTCTASFVRQFAVTYSAGTGGAVSAPANQCPSGSPCTLDTGSNLDVTATASTGYRFAGWSGAGCSDSDANTPSVANLANITSAITCTASFTRQFAVTYTASTGGAVSAPASQCPTGSPCTLDTGSDLSVTATPSTGYRFGSWTGTGCTDSDTSSANVADLANITANVTCTANFIRLITVTYSAGTGGSVSAPANQCPAGSPCSLDSGANLDVTATASSGYRFGGWTGTGCTDSATGTANVADLVNITGNVTCTASFVRQLSVTYSAGTGGSVSAPAAQCPAGSPCTVDTGSNLDVTAVATTGYRFGGWTGTGCTDSDTSTANVADLVNITANVTCTASFTRQLTVTYSAGTGGSVSAPANQCPSGSPCTVDTGANLNVTAAITSGYRFAGWTGTGCTDSNPDTPSVVELTNITANVTCTASFTRQFTVTYSAGNGGGVSAPASQCPAGSPCTLDTGANLAVTASANTGFRFASWSGAGCTDSNSSTPTVVELANITGNITCTATFTQQFSVTYSAGTGGSVSAPTATCPSGSPCTVDSDTDLAITAAPLAGYRFGSWSGTGCTDSTPATANIANLTGINSNVTCVANFVRQFTVTYSAGTGGTVSAPANQCPVGSPCTLDQGSNLAVTAAPQTGYRLGGWSGAGCVDSNSSTFNVMDLGNLSANVTCTATFVRQFVVNYSANIAAANGLLSTPTTQCPSGSPCGVDAGATVNITANQNANFRFVNWTGTNCTDTMPTTPNVADLTVNTDVTCVANYVARVTVAGNAPAGMTITSSTNSPLPNCGGATCTVDSGSNVTLTAPTAPAGMRMAGWTGAGCVDSQPGTVNTLELVGVTNNLTCTADYRNTVTVKVALATNSVAGTINITTSSPGGACLSNANGIATQCTVDVGSSVTIIATESGNVRFYNWTGGSGCDSTNGTNTFAATASVTCNADFYGVWAWGYGNGKTNDPFVALYPLTTTGLIAVGSQVVNSNVLNPSSKMQLGAVNADTGDLPLPAGAVGHTINLYGGPDNTSLLIKDVQGTADTFVVAGDWNTAGFPIFQSFGKTAWTRRLGTANDTLLDRLTIAQDKLYMAAGYTTVTDPNTGAMSEQAHLTAFTSDGALRFDTQFCAPNKCTAACLTTHSRGAVLLGDFVIAVNSVWEGKFAAPWFAQFKTDGTETKAEAIFRSGTGVEVSRVLALADNTMLLIGRVEEAAGSSLHDGFFLHVDANFKLLTSVRYIRASMDDSFDSIIATSDGDFLIAGFADRSQDKRGKDGWLLRVDVKGNVQDTFAYGTQVNETFLDVRAALNGGYLLSGTTYNGADDDGWLLRIDDSLQVPFNATFGGQVSKLDFTMGTINFDISSLNCITNTATNSAFAAFSQLAPTSTTLQFNNKEAP